MALHQSDAAAGVLYTSFNQDGSCIIMGTSEGIRIYSINSHRIVNDDRVGAVCVAEMLFNTCLVGYVGAGACNSGDA